MRWWWYQYGGGGGGSGGGGGGGGCGLFYPLGLVLLRHKNEICAGPSLGDGRDGSDQVDFLFKEDINRKTFST